MILCQGGGALTIERGEFVPAAATGVWQFTGEKGALRLDMIPGEHQRIVHDHFVPGEGVRSDVIFEGACTGDVLHRGVIEDFARAIRGAGSPATTLENARLLQQLLDGIYRSAETEEIVALS